MLSAYSAFTNSLETNEICKEAIEDAEQEQLNDKAKSRNSSECMKADKASVAVPHTIEVRGLPKFIHHVFKQFLEYEMSLDIVKIISCSTYPKHCYLTFKDALAAERAVIHVDGLKWRGNILTASRRSHPLDTSKETQNLPMEEKVAQSVTPYASMSYEEQLAKKQEAAQNILEKIGQEMARVNPTIGEFVRWQMIRRRGAVCELDPIIPSPVEDGYRNMCEFSIGVNHDTQQVTVGFRVGGIKEGNVSVFPVQHLRQINDAMKKVAKSFEAYVQTTLHPALDPVTQEGVWRRLTVRTSNTGDCLLVVNLNITKLSGDEVSAIKKDLQDYCENDGRRVGVTSLFCSYGTFRESGVCDVNDHLWGKTYVTETVLGKTFKVSLQSFFRVNTSVAEKLCEAVAELSEISTNDVLVDICSSTGTIGISLAERVLKVFSLEVCETAVDDAQHNALHNNATNVELMLGNCENTLSSVYEATKGLRVKAVIDPPRAGLRNSRVATLIESLREQDEVSTVVYVACDSDKWPQNFQCFVKPMSKLMRGQVFVPVRAVALDLVPHTEKFELIIVWERYDETKWRNIMSGTPLPHDEAYFKRLPEAPPLHDYIKLLEEKQKAKAQAPYKGPSANRRRKDRFKGGPNYYKGPQRRQSPGSQVQPPSTGSGGPGQHTSRPSDSGRPGGGSSRSEYTHFRGGRRDHWYSGSNQWEGGYNQKIRDQWEGGYSQKVGDESGSWRTGHQGDRYSRHSADYGSFGGERGKGYDGGAAPGRKMPLSRRGAGTPNGRFGGAYDGRSGGYDGRGSVYDSRGGGYDGRGSGEYDGRGGSRFSGYKEMY